MPRRFQFRLKTLLAVTALSAVSVFVWQAYPFASIRIAPPGLGRGIEFHGSFVNAFGPGKFALWYELDYCKDGIPRRSIDFGDLSVAPSGLGLYRFQGVSFPIEAPGEYRLQILRFEPPPVLVTDLIATQFSVGQ